jgi:hypothetical protein
MVDVKNRQVNIRDCGVLSQINNPNNIPSPNSEPYQVAFELERDPTRQAAIC